MKKKGLLLLLILVSLSAMGCRRDYMVPIYEEVATSETAFLISLEGNTKEGQAKFDSEEFLQQSKVAAKSVEIRQKWVSDGYRPREGYYKPIEMLLKISRSPVSREWTASSDKGTTSRNEGFTVESADSIEFTIGGTCTAMVTEENTARFAYFYTGTQLAEIMDTNIRNSIQTGLSSEFGKDDLATGRTKKADIFDRVMKAVTDLYATKGITIIDGGISGGMVYTNQAIQDTINKEFESGLLANVRKNEKEAQAEVNEMKEAEATSAKNQANIWAEASVAQTKKTGLEIQLLNAQANLERAKRWDGKLPSNIMPANSPMLMGLTN